MLFSGPILKLAKWDVDDNLSRLPRRQVDPFKTTQDVVSELDTRGRIRWLVDVDLRNLVSGHRARILDCHLDIESVIHCRRGARIRISKMRV